jgi:hypothetical protein
LCVARSSTSITSAFTPRERSASDGSGSRICLSRSSWNVPENGVEPVSSWNAMIPIA